MIMDGQPSYHDQAGVPDEHCLQAALADTLCLAFAGMLMKAWSGRLTAASMAVSKE